MRPPGFGPGFPRHGSFEAWEAPVIDQAVLPERGLGDLDHGLEELALALGGQPSTANPKPIKSNKKELASAWL